MVDRLFLNSYCLFVYLLFFSKEQSPAFLETLAICTLLPGAYQYAWIKPAVTGYRLDKKERPCDCSLFSQHFFA